MKNKLTILFFLISTFTFACSCIEQKPILEFYSSEYVFEGEIVSKIYAKDSLTYKITFEILKHYKKESSPKKLEFEAFSKVEWDSKGNYVGKGSDCDSYPEKDETWLIYAKSYKGKLYFPSICSNSKNLDYREIRMNEQRILNNGNFFKLGNYIYEHERDFNYTKPISDINSILRTGDIKDYKKPYTWLKLFIDKKGYLKSVTTHDGYELEGDSIFPFATEFKIKLKRPLTEFEKDAIKLVKKIKKWEIKKHENTNISVLYIQHLTIEFDKERKKWKYDL